MNLPEGDCIHLRTVHEYQFKELKGIYCKDCGAELLSWDDRKIDEYILILPDKP